MKNLFLWLLIFSAIVCSASAPSLETRIRIAVVDSGLLMSKEIAPYVCLDGHKDFTMTGLGDRHGHGTNVSHLIAKSIDPKKYCLVIVKWYDPKAPPILSGLFLTAATEYAAHSGAQYINISAGGGAKYQRERNAIEYAVEHGVRVVVAAGNEGVDMSPSCPFFPACYPIHSNSFYVVGALEKDGKKAWFSNYGGPVNAWAPGTNQEGGGIVMSGTSQATAVYTGLLVARESK
jgi:subtilisin family serine protease